MSRVTCHVSGVTCHVSGVTCILYILFFEKKGEASRWRVCYQRGLPRLVSICSTLFPSISPQLPYGLFLYEVQFKNYQLFQMFSYMQHIFIKWILLFVFTK